MPEISDILVRILIGLGSLAAGTGIFFAGARFGRLADRLGGRIPAALEAQSAAAQKLVEANQRQATALEQHSALLPLMSRLSDQRQELIEKQEQTGRLLRVLSREMRELKETVTGEAADQS